VYIWSVVDLSYIKPAWYFPVIFSECGLSLFNGSLLLLRFYVLCGNIPRKFLHFVLSPVLCMGCYRTDGPPFKCYSFSQIPFMRLCTLVSSLKVCLLVSHPRLVRYHSSGTE
jgi:hypothetical protein